MIVFKITIRDALKNSNIQVRVFLVRKKRTGTHTHIELLIFEFLLFTSSGDLFLHLYGIIDIRRNLQRPCI